MKAVIAHGQDDLRVEEIAEPGLPDDRVMVAMEWGGICGSDISYWEKGFSGTATLQEPLVLGHEVAGRIERIGAQARAEMDELGLSAGDPVTVHPATLVGAHDVDDEIAARTNLWPEVRYFGSAAFFPHEQGAFSSHRAVRPDQLRRVPEGVGVKEAALAEPFGVALHAVSQAGDLTGCRVLVNGCGPIGALAVAAALRAGAERVIAADLSGDALTIAQRMGAGEIVDLSSAEQLPRDVEVAIEASGAPAALAGVIASVRRGGTLIQVGNLPGGEVPVALGGIVTREITYRGSYRFVDEITDALRLMAEGVDVSPLMTHQVPLDDAVRGFELAADRSTGSSKVMIDLRPRG